MNNQEDHSEGASASDPGEIFKQLTAELTGEPPVSKEEFKQNIAGFQACLANFFDSNSDQRVTAEATLHAAHSKLLRGRVDHHDNPDLYIRSIASAAIGTALFQPGWLGVQASPVFFGVQYVVQEHPDRKEDLLRALDQLRNNLQALVAMHEYDSALWLARAFHGLKSLLSDEFICVEYFKFVEIFLNIGVESVKDEINFTEQVVALAESCFEGAGLDKKSPPLYARFCTLKVLFFKKQDPELKRHAQGVIEFASKGLEIYNELERCNEREKKLSLKTLSDALFKAHAASKKIVVLVQTPEEKAAESLQQLITCVKKNSPCEEKVKNLLVQLEAASKADEFLGNDIYQSGNWPDLFNRLLKALQIFSAEDYQVFRDLEPYIMQKRAKSAFKELLTPGKEENKVEEAKFDDDKALSSSSESLSSNSSEAGDSGVATASSAASSSAASPSRLMPPQPSVVKEATQKLSMPVKSGRASAPTRLMPLKPVEPKVDYQEKLDGLMKRFCFIRSDDVYQCVHDCPDTVSNYFSSVLQKHGRFKNFTYQNHKFRFFNLEGACNAVSHINVPWFFRSVNDFVAKDQKTKLENVQKIQQEELCKNTTDQAYDALFNEILDELVSVAQQKEADQLVPIYGDVYCENSALCRGFFALKEERPDFYEKANPVNKIAEQLERDLGYRRFRV